MSSSTTMNQLAQKPKAPVYCRTCNAEIRFHKDHRGSNGGWVPLNPDLSVHDCPKKPHQKASPTPTTTTTTPVEVKQQQQQPSTNNDVAEISAFTSGVETIGAFGA